MGFQLKIILRIFLVMAVSLLVFNCTGRSTTELPSLSVLDINPGNLTQGIRRDESITIAFDQNIDEQSVNQNSIIVSDQFGNLVEPVEINVNDNLVNLKPGRKLLQRTTYSVTVTTQVRSVSGSSLSTNFISSFTTQVNDWYGPSYFQANGHPTMAIDDDGNLVTAIWRYNSSNFTYEIIREEYRDGAWNQPQVISGIQAQSYSPSVAVDNNGNAIIVWNVSSDSTIMICELRNGTWSEPRVFSTLNRPVSNPSVSMNDAGDAIVVWENNRTLYKSEYSSGIWNTPVVVSNNDGNADNPKVILKNSGDGSIIWNHRDLSTGRGRLFSVELRNGLWSAPKLISVSGGNVSPLYDIAMDSEGNIIAVWQQSSDIFKNEFREGSWLTPVQLNPIGVWASGGRVAMSDNGSATIVWQQLDSVINIVASIYDNGSWSSSITVSDGQYQSRGATVEMDGYGNALIGWSQINGDAWWIMSQQYFNGDWKTELIFGISYNSVNAISPGIAMNYSGDAIIAWRAWDLFGDFYQYRSQYY